MNGVLPIALSGLFAATRRLSASAENLANAETSGSTEPGGRPPYQPWLVVQTGLKSGGVLAELRRSGGSYLPVFAPDDAQADAEGMIGLPDVDLATELVDQARALAAFKANLAVIRTADEMAEALLDTRA